MRKRLTGLRFKLISIICILMAVMGVALMGVSYKAFYNTYVKFYHDKALGIAKMLAEEVDGDKIASYVETGITDGQYDRMQEIFNNVKKNTSGLNYLYLMVPYDDHFVYVLEAYTDNDNMDLIASLGERFEYGEMEYKYLLPDVKAKKASTQYVYGAGAGYGIWNMGDRASISVWVPVFDKNGEVAAMIECDYVLTEIRDKVNQYVRRILLFFTVALAVIAAVMIYVVGGSVVNPILALKKYVDSYEKGSLSVEPVKFRGDNEIKQLSDAFCGMVGKIEEYVSDIRHVTAEKERISTELCVATQIQANMLPCIFPAFPDRKEFDIYASMTPAKEVGGDFYDFYLLDDDHLAMVMADVSGKGVPAALFMVISKTLLKDHARSCGSPAKILEKVNNLLYESNAEGMFVTVWLGIMEISTGRIVASNAGHEIPALRNPGGNFELVRNKHGMMIGAMPGITFKEYEMQLEYGSTLFLYTDGVPEATNVQNELFNTERMLDALNINPAAEPERLLANVKGKVDEFVGEAPQFDDLTMLAIVRR